MHSGSLLSTPISQHTHTEIANQSSVFIFCRDWMSSFSTSQHNVPGNQLDLVHSIKCACHPRFNLKGVFSPSWALWDSSKKTFVTQGIHKLTGYCHNQTRFQRGSVDSEFKTEREIIRHWSEMMWEEFVLISFNAHWERERIQTQRWNDLRRVCTDILMHVERWRIQTETWPPWVFIHLLS